MSLRGEAGWQATYQKTFGKERWKGLCRSLRGPVEYVALVNRFLEIEAQAKIKNDHQLREHESIPLVCRCASAVPAACSAGDVADADAADVLVGLSMASAAAVGAGPQAMESTQMPCYFLDGASVIAALALGVEPSDAVLDLCAAPGGKSLVLASMLFVPESGGRLVCNDPSRARAQRLQRVLASFLPEALVGPSGRVSITTVDAATGAQPVAIQRLGPYDRVLVDAPCTSDRHLAHQGGAALARWASGVVKANASRQLELLRTGASLVKPGGLVLYCTCALAEQENEGVVAKFLKKKEHDFEAEPWTDADVAGAASGEEAGGGARATSREGASPATSALPAGAEIGAIGALILPDRTGYGPMYIARLRRL